MATNSSISVKCSDGTWKSIYCHFDGYLKYNGAILLQFFNNQERAEALVNLGDVSQLDAKIDKPENHSYDTPVKGYAIFYGRDRGEKDTEAWPEASLKESIRRIGFKEYNYVWNGEYWLCNDDKLEYAACGIGHLNPVKVLTPAEKMYNVVNSAAFNEWYETFNEWKDDPKAKPELVASLYALFQGEGK